MGVSFVFFLSFCLVIFTMVVAELRVVLARVFGQKLVCTTVDYCCLWYGKWCVAFRRFASRPACLPLVAISWIANSQSFWNLALRREQLEFRRTCYSHSLSNLKFPLYRTVYCTVLHLGALLTTGSTHNPTTSS